MKICARYLLTPEGFLRDRTVHIQDGVITGIGPAVQDADVTCHTCVPGLIDQHVHGGYGADLMASDADKILNWLRFLLKNGVTQVLAGIYTFPIPVMRKAMQVVREVMNLQSEGAGGAMLTGIHLEGPFISHGALGAMDDRYVLAPTVDNYKALSEGFEDIIRLITIAPEEDADELIGYLTKKGVPILAGHTAATVEEGVHAFELGVGGVCHFFNASTPIHHRKPGILTEGLLNRNVYCECIADFVHVHPKAVELIYRMKGADRMILVSDAVSTTGLPDGEYIEENGTRVIVKNGESRTPEGNLNGGSSLSLQDVRNMIKIGVPRADAFHMASKTPASFLRIAGGRIIPGARAEILCLDENDMPICTVLGTQEVRA
ncbi:MAG: hypothetical protein E7326_03820 [Clostridiales bacterium]|nr:hypothetical protein [Clostridiales bacterium]